MSKSFSLFTNQYALSKTLRFELRPIGNTKQMLEENNVFGKDKVINEKYKKTKDYIDKLHIEFVNEALSGKILIGLDQYKKVFDCWLDNPQKNQKELEAQEKALRKEVVKLFDTKAKDWKEQYPGLKKYTYEILLEEAVFESLLKVKYGEDEETFLKNEMGDFLLDENGERISIFDSWKGFIGYFTKLFKNRKNLYKSDGKNTAIATRIVDQNLKRFCKNLKAFETAKQKIDFTEIEKEFQISTEKIFSINFYNNCLLQKGIDYYNLILGGETLSNGEKKKGLNELINEFRQQNNDKSVSYLNLLEKQILSPKEKLFDLIEDEESLKTSLQMLLETAEQKAPLIKNLFSEFFENPESYDLHHIYLSQKALNTISHRWFNNITSFEQSLYEEMKSKKTIGIKYDKKTDTYKFPDFISLKYIKGSLDKNINEKIWKDRYYVDILDLSDKSNWRQFLSIFEFEFNSKFRRNLNSSTNLEIGLEPSIYNLKQLLLDFKIDRTSTIVIKDFADSLLNVYQLSMYFAVEKKRSWVNEYELDSFYTNPKNGYLLFYENAYEEIVQTYNQIRNYITQKTYIQEKWKLNFDNSTLANGWDKNKESDNFALILKKSNRFYLGLMKKGHNHIFNDRNLDKMKQNLDDNKYEKIVYKFFPDQAKMFPKVCFSQKGLDFFKPSSEILSIYRKSEFKKGDSFSLSSMHKLIDFYKYCLNKYEGWQCYNFNHLKPTQEYTQNIGVFFRDVAQDSYKIEFQDISESYIQEKNNLGELYLFEIHNKDWNLDKGASKTGKKNLHTMYFESLFSQENIDNNFPFKLNGQAEIFYRPKTEPKNLRWKKDSTGRKVIDHKRYSKDKIFFHVPLTVNRTKTSPARFNQKVNNFLANNPEVNIIGIDRGEKHLAYYSVIDQNKKILESGSLNFISNKNSKGDIILKDRKKLKEVKNDRDEIIRYEIVKSEEKVEYENYKLLLDCKERNRKLERQNWQDVEQIKDLKKGYISQVVRKLADLAIKYNAIIVFEDLNMRFKQIRGGIEKSTYQQLEKALIEKLNFLVNKGEIDFKKAGHLLNAYQLTAPVEAFKDMGKQTGIIFYTTASYTSKIDPITGWRPNLYLKYTSAEKTKMDILNFSEIKYQNNRFELTYDIKNFQEIKDPPLNTTWTVCSCVERFKWNRNANNNQGTYEYYPNVTEGIMDLFKEFGINHESDILSQIKKLNSKGNERFFKSFIFYWSLICQIRNTNTFETGDNNDFIQSPVYPFFDSRKENGDQAPKNGDDNGAYNIAKKGLIILDKISTSFKQNGSCSELKWRDLYISNTEWDNFNYTKVTHP